MIVSVFARAQDNVPKMRSLEWDEFVQGIGPHRETAVTDKRQLPAFSPAEWIPGTTKLKCNVIRVHFGVLDLDHLTIPQVETVVRSCDGLDAALYTTYSHASDPWRLRLAVRLSRPVEAVEFDPWWPVFNARFGGFADPKTKDSSRIYFGALCPTGTLHLQHFVKSFGRPLDVSSLHAQVQNVVRTGTHGGEKITRERLANLAKTWKRSKDESRQYLGEALGRVCRGEPFAEPGSRDTTAFQLARDLIRTWPQADPESLAAHFAQSVQIMAWGEGDMVAKLARAADDVNAEFAARELTTVSETKIRIAEAFAAQNEPGRDWPYTEVELEALTTRCKCSREELRKRWIVQRGTLFYILTPKGYTRPYGEKDVWTATLRDLAPARSAGVNLWTPNERGDMVRKTMIQLMADYGTVAQEHVLDLRLQESRYDSASRTFYDAPTPIRAEVVPRYDPEVDGWLDVLGGDLLKDWISMVTDLGSTCVALILTGPGDTGKTLLAHGLSRIWTTTQPTSLEQVMGTFNGALARCPLVFADEQIPKDFRGNSRTQELRELLGNMSRPYREKYHPDAVILGVPRLMVAANNEEVLTFQGDLTKNDVEAIAARFLHIEIEGNADKCKAREYLQGLTQSLVETFVTHDRIACHALWLRDNHKIVRRGRFQVKSPTQEKVIRSLTTKGGLKSSLCQWFVGYLKNPTLLDVRCDFKVRILGGKLLVNTQAVVENWSLYVDNEPVPPVGRISNTIGQLSLGDSDSARVHLKHPGGGSCHYRVIDPLNLIAWAEATGYSTRDEVYAALGVDTEKRVRAFQVPGTELFRPRPN